MCYYGLSESVWKRYHDRSQASQIELKPINSWPISPVAIFDFIHENAEEMNFFYNYPALAREMYRVGQWTTIQFALFGVALATGQLLSFYDSPQVADYFGPLNEMLRNITFAQIGYVLAAHPWLKAKHFDHLIRAHFFKDSGRISGHYREELQAVIKLASQFKGNQEGPLCEHIELKRKPQAARFESREGWLQGAFGSMEE